MLGDTKLCLCLGHPKSLKPSRNSPRNAGLFPQPSKAPWTESYGKKKPWEDVAESRESHIITHPTAPCFYHSKTTAQTWNPQKIWECITLNNGNECGCRAEGQVRAARTRECRTGAGTAPQPTELFVLCIPGDPVWGGLNRFGFQGSLPAPPRTPGGSCQGETEGPGVENCWNSFLCIPGLSAPCLAARFPTLRAEGAQNSLPAQNTRDFPLFSQPKRAGRHRSHGICVFVKLMSPNRVLIFQFQPSHETNRSFEGSEQN